MHCIMHIYSLQRLLSILGELYTKPQNKCAILADQSQGGGTRQWDCGVECIA